MLHHRLLTYLDAVARSGSIRRAAARLGVASSAVNRQILALETEMGTALFERLPHGLRPTAAGDLLIRHVRDTLREHERMRAEVAALRGLTRGEVGVATMASLAGSVLAGVLRAFRLSHPHIAVRVHVLSGEEVVEALLSGSVDLALAYRMPRTNRLRCIARFEHPLGAVTAPDHPLGGRYHLRMVQCLAYPLIVPDRSMTLRTLLEQLVPPGASLVPAVETNSVELMKQLAQEPPHIAFLNLSDIRDEIARACLAFTPLSEAAAVTQTATLAQRANATLDAAAHLLAIRIGTALDRHGAAD